ncbi:MAG: T9SS type A sorting domain-containing protein, partial [Saprospiraceae bacterium]
VYIVPNLVSEYFEIKNAPDEFGYTLFNAAGQILKQVNRTTNRLIHVSNFESGVYFMAIQNGSSQKTLRWIKY